jgi:hypothetical protein
MKFEQKKEELASFSRFFIRMIRYSLFALGLITISVLIGTVGYRFLGNLSWLDSFHMTCMILTGMGPVIEMKTSTAKIFSSFYALYSGIAFLSITAVFMAPLIHRLLHILHLEEDENDNSNE